MQTNEMSGDTLRKFKVINDEEGYYLALYELLCK